MLGRDVSAASVFNNTPYLITTGQRMEFIRPPYSDNVSMLEIMHIIMVDICKFITVDILDEKSN